MSYQLIIEKRPLRFLEKLPPGMAVRLATAIDALQHQPRPPDIKALRGSLHGLYQLRVGDYRVVYDVDDQRRLARVIDIGHRSHIYG